MTGRVTSSWSRHAQATGTAGGRGSLHRAALADDLAHHRASVTPRPAPPYSSDAVMPNLLASAIALRNPRDKMPSSSRNLVTTDRTPSRMALISSSVGKGGAAVVGVSRLSDRRENLARGLEVRNVNHLAVYP